MRTSYSAMISMLLKHLSLDISVLPGTSLSTRPSIKMYRNQWNKDLNIRPEVIKLLV